jgi:hypothetical protein
MNPHDGGQVAGGEAVGAAEHREGDFAGGGLAFEPALADAQDCGGLL